MNSLLRATGYLLAVFTLSACSILIPETEPTATPETLQSVARASPRPTSTPTVTPGPTLTATPYTAAPLAASTVPIPIPTDVPVISPINVAGLEPVWQLASDVSVYRVEWSEQENLIGIGTDRGIEIRGFPSLELDQVILDGPSDFAIRRDGEALVAGSSGAVTLWDLARSLPVQEYRDPGDWTSSANLAWSADEQQIASSVAWPLARGVFVVIHIWDVDTGAKVRTIYEESIGYSFELAFRPDGAELASGSRLDGKVHFWDTRTGDLLGNVEGERVQYNPVGDLIATAIDSSVWIWDAETKALIRKFEVGGEESELPIAFSPDGALFVAGKDRIIIWNVRDWTEVVSLPIAGGSLRSLQFSPSGKYLASVNGQTTLNDGEWIRDYTATLWAIDS